MLGSVRVPPPLDTLDWLYLTEGWLGPDRLLFEDLLVRLASEEWLGYNRLLVAQKWLGSNRLLVAEVMLVEEERLVVEEYKGLLSMRIWKEW